MQFSPLSDLTSYTQNYDNVQRQSQRKAAIAAPVPAVVEQAPPVRVVRTHNPYSAQVLGSRFVTQAPAPAYVALPPPPPPMNLLNLSNESATSSSSGQSSSSPTTSFVVRTPVRREYRNGRPVPVFTGSQ